MFSQASAQQDIVSIIEDTRRGGSNFAQCDDGEIIRSKILLCRRCFNFGISKFLAC